MIIFYLCPVHRYYLVTIILANLVGRQFFYDSNVFFFFVCWTLFIIYSTLCARIFVVHYRIVEWRPHGQIFLYVVWRTVFPPHDKWVYLFVLPTVANHSPVVITMFWTRLAWPRESVTNNCFISTLYRVHQKHFHSLQGAPKAFPLPTGCTKSIFTP
jgi:hypothetical protein